MICDSGLHLLTLDKTNSRNSENDLPFLEKELVDGFAVNVVGVAKTISAFLPLIKKSTIKKVIALSTGLADLGMFPLSMFDVHLY